MTPDLEITRMDARCNSRGFTLTEIAIVIAIMGLVLAFALPAFLRYNESLQLKGATQNIAAQLNLAREKAIATGTMQRMHFAYNSFGGDYHIHNLSEPISLVWKLPNRVTYYWGTGTIAYTNPAFFVEMLGNGRAAQSGMVILQDSRGNKDTVTVQLSGLVLVQ